MTLRLRILFWCLGLIPPGTGHEVFGAETASFGRDIEKFTMNASNLCRHELLLPYVALPAPDECIQLAHGEAVELLR